MSWTKGLEIVHRRSDSTLQQVLRTSSEAGRQRGYPGRLTNRRSTTFTTGTDYDVPTPSAESHEYLYRVLIVRADGERESRRKRKAAQG